MPDHGPSTAPFPRFSDGEMARRRALLQDAMEERGVSHAVVYGANRFGSGVQWLTNWPVSREAMVLVEPGERDILLVQFYNHVPNAREIAVEADVRWGGASSAATMRDLMRERRATRVGTIGPLTAPLWNTLAEAAPLVTLDGAYTEMRSLKSIEELEFLRFAAELTDRGMEALAETAGPGVGERELAAAVEAAYRAEGAVDHVHYFAVTSMETPGRCVPAQQQGARMVSPGDVVVAEISASYWDYAGQVLRSFYVATEPSSLYRDLHAVADEAFGAITAVLRDGATCAEIVAAAGVIEDAGFTTYDDLLHGFGGGYLPPILGSKSRTHAPVPDVTLRSGMTVVVQPNVITTDERAGVQTGELVTITDDGCESLHRVPRGFRRIG